MYSFILLISLTAFTSELKATHVAAVDLTYSKTSNPNEYEILLKIYRDCMGQYAEDSIPMCLKSDICNIMPSQTNHFYIYKEPGRRYIDYPECIGVKKDDTYCGAALGMKYGIEEHIYKTTVIITQQCPDWQFQFGWCCRNNNITTITSGVLNVFVDAMLDNLNVTHNNSPVFGQDPIIMGCVNNPVVYDHLAADPDGDSLAYELVPALEQGLSCYFNYAVDTVNYIAPYSGTNPIATVSGVFVDPVTGITTFTPTMAQTGVMDVLVKEYRNGLLIGTSRRDIQIHITDNCNIIPQFITSIINGIPDAIEADCGDTSIVLATNIPFDCNTLAADNSDFFAINGGGQPIPINKIETINCDSSFTDSLRITFNSPLQSGISKIILIKGTDNNTLSGKCQSDMIENDTVNIVVTGNLNISLGNDTTICIGDTIILNASGTGAADITWQDSSKNSNFIVHQPGQYFVTISNNSCIASDTILISKDSITVKIAGNSFICEGDTVLLTATGSDTMDLIWQDGSNDISFLATKAGIYSVTASYGSCKATDSILISDESVTVELGKDTLICSGDEIILFASSSNALYYLWQDNSTGTEITTGEAGVFFVTASNDNCSSSDTTVISLKDCTDIKPCKVAIPNAFSPDNNGLNDLYGVIHNCEFTFFNMKIYNRWGNLIYEASDADVQWDGYYKNELQPDGTYAFIIEYQTYNSDSREIKKGNLQLLH